MLDTQVGDLERRMESVIAQYETSAAEAELLRSIPGIGPVSATMLIAEMPELRQMTAGEVAAITGISPVLKDSERCEGGAQSPADGGHCDICCFRLHSPPHVTIQF